MKTRICILLGLASLLTVGPAIAEDAPTTAEHMSALTTMCSESADARTARQVAKPLYERLGGYDRILELTTEIVRLHNINPAFTRFMPDVDAERLAKHVADFVAAGTGGTAEYTGRSMPAAHAHLKLSDADFLAAGGDVITAMKSMDYGQEEIDEFVCILVSFKDQVVFK